MLVLTRRIGETIVIDGDIQVTVLEVNRGRVRLGITAPTFLEVMRHELVARNQTAAQGTASAAAQLSSASSDTQPCAAEKKP